MKYQNPILPGFNPDPSIILHEGTFYLVTSSFHVFPGLPIYVSKDLQSWLLIGNAINRPSQLDLSTATTRMDDGKTMVATAGLWAPTIRFHKDKFYIVCTNCVLDGTNFIKHSFYITCPTADILASNADELASKWSDPIYFDFDVIDPSIFFDEDDRVYIQGCVNLFSRKTGQKKIQPSCTLSQIEIEIETGKILVPAKEIWPGFAKIDTEGPHIYKKDGWYYLLAAEGGTFEHHLLSIARSRNIWGPYESYENNPILTADGKDEYIQNTGHGDLFQDTEGAWWAVVLAVRNENGRFPLGRETFLTPVTWPENGWPEIAQPKMEFERESGVVEKFVDKSPDCNIRDVFLNLHELVYIRKPILENYRIHQGTTEVEMKAGTADLSAYNGAVSFVGRRQTTLECSAKACLILEPEKMGKNLKAGLAVYKDSFRYARIYFNFATDKIIAEFVNGAREGGEGIREVDFKDAGLLGPRPKVAFRISATKKGYELMYMRNDTRSETTLLEIDAKEMTARDFTGPLFGVFACGNEETKDEEMFFDNFVNVDD